MGNFEVIINSPRYNDHNVGILCAADFKKWRLEADTLQGQY